MAMRHMKRCSKLKKKKCKLKLHLDITSHHNQKVAIKKKKIYKQKCWREYEEKETVLHCWWECKLVQPLWGTIWGLLKNVKTAILFNSQDMETNQIAIDR